MAQITAADLRAGAQGLREEWLERAACGGRSRVMDPPLADRTDAARERALAVCRSCPVMAECRTWALDLPPRMSPGWVIGGLTEADIVKRRIAAGQVPEGHKRCSRCRQIKAFAEFHTHAHTIDGRMSACAACACAAERARRKEKRRDRT